jgi:hypothetical protein
MKRPQNCVKCGATLTTKEILAAGPFPCPTCHTQLQAAESYGVWVGYGSALVDGLVFWALGVRSLYLVLAVILAWFPTVYVVVMYIKHIIRPKIEIYLPKDATLRLRD